MRMLIAAALAACALGASAADRWVVAAPEEGAKTAPMWWRVEAEPADERGALDDHRVPVGTRCDCSRAVAVPRKDDPVAVDQLCEPKGRRLRLAACEVRK